MDPFARGRPPAYRDRTRLHLRGPGRSWELACGIRPAAHGPLRLSAATRLAVTHQELKMPWRRSNKASVKFNYRISYLLLDLIA